MLGLETPLVKVDYTTDLKTLYASLEWGDGCDDAAMREVIVYLRGSRLLNIPEDWRPLLPTTL